MLLVLGFKAFQEWARGTVNVRPADRPSLTSPTSGWRPSVEAVKWDRVPTPVLDAVSRNSDEDASKAAIYGRIDIDRDGTPEWLVSDVPGFIGSGGTSYFLYKIENGRAEDVLGPCEAFGVNLTFESPTEHEVPDIYLSVRDYSQPEMTEAKMICRWVNGAYR